MTTHDYRRDRCGWGHDYVDVKVLDETGRIKALGWGYGLKVGDVTVFTGRESAILWYTIEAVSYFSDPQDMWNATFAPTAPGSAESLK